MRGDSSRGFVCGIVGPLPRDAPAVPFLSCGSTLRYTVSTRKCQITLQRNGTLSIPYEYVIASYRSSVRLQSMLTDMALVFRVREFREVKGWTQAELARRCALRPATLSAIETNSTTGIDLATLEAIADALDVEPGFLIAREPRTKKPASRRR